jgi:putative transposase
MPNYRRVWVPGATCFFTVNLLERNHPLLVRHIVALREAFREARRSRPFLIVAVVVLPEHLHCIWRLPHDDADNATRWRHIKTAFSRCLPAEERRSQGRIARSERGVWQRRYWEHLIRDEADLAAHIAYIHFNPVKHGWVARVRDWPYSSFHRYVEAGLLDRDWGGDVHGVPPLRADSGESPRLVDQAVDLET